MNYELEWAGLKSEFDLATDIESCLMDEENKEHQINIMKQMYDLYHYFNSLKLKDILKNGLEFYLKKYSSFELEVKGDGYADIKIPFNSIKLEVNLDLLEDETVIYCESNYFFLPPEGFMLMCEYITFENNEFETYLG